MVILVVWLLMGVLGTVAIGLATHRIARTWNVPGMRYLTMYLASSALYHALIAVVAFRAILTYSGASAMVGAIILTIAQLIVTLPALAFAGFLLGLIGQPKEHHERQ